MKPSRSEDNKTPRNRTDLEMFLKKTPLMVLEEAAKAVYQKTPTWGTVELPEGFEMTLILNEITVKGQATSKKAARQKAAVEYLRKVVEKGKHEIFFIPGTTKEEALSNIDQISDKAEELKRSTSDAVQDNDNDDSIPTSAEFPPGISPTENWVGKLQEKSQKSKLQAPIYEDSKNERTERFLVICTMCNQKTRGIRSKKKDAKNLAAWLMWKALEDGIESLESYDMVDVIENLEEAEHLLEIQDQASKIKDKHSALIDILSDKKRFSDYSMDFNVLSVSTMGIHQVLLEISFRRLVSPDPDDLEMGAEHTQTEEIMKATAEKEKLRKKNMPDSGPLVFAGHGSSAEEAKQCACKSAIIHFNTYDFTD